MTDQTITPLPDAPRTSGVRRAVRIDQEGGRAAVFVDDTDIAGSVTAATVDIKAGHLPEVTFTMLPGQFAFIGDTALLKVDDATRTALLKLGWTPPHPKIEQVGDATVEIGPDGTRIVTRADDTILVSPELLAEMEKLGNYVDNVFTLDTAGEYRYRSAGFFGPNAIFDRIHETEAPA